MKKLFLFLAVALAACSPLGTEPISTPEAVPALTVLPTVTAPAIAAPALPGRSFRAPALIVLHDYISEDGTCRSGFTISLGRDLNLWCVSDGTEHVFFAPLSPFLLDSIPADTSGDRSGYHIAY
jgi:hypothetical protein